MNKLTSNRSWMWVLALVTVPFLGGARECEPSGACVCPEIWAPVCGVDGVTYGNTCEADCAAVPVDHDGECAPEPRTCWDDAECGPSEVCDRDECHSPCGPGEICPAVCYGICEPAPPPRVCTADADCGPGAHCTLDGPCPDCPPDAICPAIACAGLCEPDPDPRCFADGDCAPGEVCIYDGGPPCSGDGDPTIFAPPSGICVAPPEPAECWSDADCAPGEECIVDAGEPCPPGAYCAMIVPPTAGLCVPRTDPPLCSDDGDCGPGELCNHDACFADPSAPELTVCYGSCEPRVFCGEVLCDIACEHGFETDERGCPICRCAEPPPPPPSCPPVLCDLYCEGGFAVDDTGCPVCACAPTRPEACASDADCPGGACFDGLCVTPL